MIKDWKTRYSYESNFDKNPVVVWLKIGKHDIVGAYIHNPQLVVVWLKIGKHDIERITNNQEPIVVVWLKIGKHDI